MQGEDFQKLNSSVYMKRDFFLITRSNFVSLSPSGDVRLCAMTMLFALGNIYAMAEQNIVTFIVALRCRSALQASLHPTQALH